MNLWNIGQDADLTNLNWVAGTPVPINCSVSPTKEHTPKTRLPAALPPNLASPSVPHAKESTSRSRPVGRGRGTKQLVQGQHKKPGCSYTCLIAMALKASETGSLPVSEIYRYIEREFPYFKTAPDGWKNSVRHNLSLNQAFRKVERSDCWQGKKGYFWEVNPDRQPQLDREMEKFLREEGRELVQNQPSTSTPIPMYLHAAIPSMPQYSLSSHPATIYPTPMHVTPMHTTAPQNIQLTTSNMQFHPFAPMLPPPPPPLPPPLMQPLFDLRNTPTQYIGLEAPATDPHNMARDLFGLELCAEQPMQGYRPDGSVPYTPLYTTSPSFFGLMDSASLMGTPSPVVSLSPPTASTFTSPLQYVSPSFNSSYLSSSHCSQQSMLGSSAGLGLTPGGTREAARRMLHTPVAVEGLGNAIPLEDLLDVIDDQQEFETEDPLQPRSRGRNRTKMTRKPTRRNTRQRQRQQQQSTPYSLQELLPTQSQLSSSDQSLPPDILSLFLNDSTSFSLDMLSDEAKAQLEQEARGQEFKTILTNETASSVKTPVNQPSATLHYTAEPSQSDTTQNTGVTLHYTAASYNKNTPECSHLSGTQEANSLNTRGTSGIQKLTLDLLTEAAVEVLKESQEMPNLELKNL